MCLQGKEPTGHFGKKKKPCTFGHSIFRNALHYFIFSCDTQRVPTRYPSGFMWFFKLKKWKKKSLHLWAFHFPKCTKSILFFVMWHPAGTKQISIGYHGILRHLTVGITPKTKSALKCEISAPKKQLLVTSDLLVTSGMITCSSIRVRSK
jgi:hypothetical protein